METRYRGTIRTSAVSDYGLPRPSNESRSRKGHRDKDPNLTTFLGVVLFIMAVFAYIRYVDFKLPTPLTTDDIAKNPSSFIEERAMNDLKTLTSLGPRVAGSYANDVVTVDALMRIIQEIQRNKLPVYNLEIDIQKPIGSFHMSFQDGLTSSYSNIPNVIVKLEPTMGRANASILVNCHFDSVPGAPGATDDMISCAVMLEEMRIISQSQKPLRNSIIFLFNGAEENVLQGSHGFLEGKEAGSNLVGHKWSKNIKAFINLEGAGAGYREILFQTGPGNSWLLEAYRKVPYPWGSVVGEEIFQKGLIPSDTDFRIFRDFADIPGLDMAFVKNGYFYHTKFDHVDAVTPGSLQHEGSNVLTLINELGNLDFTVVQRSTLKMVFFDVFGYFMIIYSETTAVFLNILIGCIVLAISWHEVDGNWNTVLRHIAITFGAWTIGILSALAIGLLLNIFKIYSPYHSHPMMVFPLFGLPCLLGQVIFYSFALKGSEDFTWIAGKATLAVCLMATTLFTRIVFSIAFNLAFGIIGWYGARQLFRDSLLGHRGRLAFYLIIGEAFPFALSLYLSAGCIDIFVPIMGRSGSDSNPNLFLAILTSLTLTVPTCTGIVPIFVFFKKTFIRGGGLVMLLVLALTITFIGRVPYKDNTPMRVHIVEVDRSYYATDLTTVTHQDAGFWFFNVDPNIPMFYDEFSEHYPQLKNRIEVDAIECDDLYCGLPFIFPVKKLVRRTQWVPKERGFPEAMTSRVKMEIVEDAFISQDVRRVTFSFIGHDHMTINFSPGENFAVTKWSLTEVVPRPMSVLWKGRPTYFVYHARGVSFERFNVTIDFQRKESNSKGPLVDINYSVFYLHGDEMQSEDLKDLKSKLPSWTYILGFGGISHVYSIPV